MRARSGILAMFILAACGDLEVKPDSGSGKDFERAGAQQLFLDKLMDDFLSAEEGDNTDWKFFKVADKGFLKLTVFWDDHKKVDAVIDVRDRFGVLLDSRRHSGELEKDVIELRVEPGTHFVRLHTTTGSSVYTIEAVFQRFDYDPDASEDVRPVDVGAVGLDPLSAGIPGDDVRPQPVGQRPRGRPGKPRPRPPVRRPTPERAPGVAGPTVSGTINRIIDGPRRKGSYVWINKGTGDGIRNGAQGFIVDDDGSAFATLKIIKVNDRAAQAYCSATPAQIAHRRRVKVQVK